MSLKLILVSHKCGSCDKFFMAGFEFPAKYYCENDSEYWDKEEGRNCPTCHHFGANTEGEVCPDCNEEVEDVIQSVDPDQEEVIDASGNQIVSPKLKKSKKNDEEARAEADKIRKERRDKFQTIFDSEISKYKIPSITNTFRDNPVVVERKIKAVDTVIHIFASASMNPSFSFDGRGLPYQVEFRISSEGFKGKYRDDGGFCYSVGNSKDFESIDELVTYAKKRIEEV